MTQTLCMCVCVCVSEQAVPDVKLGTVNSQQRSIIVALSFPTWGGKETTFQPSCFVLVMQLLIQPKLNAVLLSFTDYKDGLKHRLTAENNSVSEYWTLHGVCSEKTSCSFQFLCLLFSKDLWNV